MPFLHTFCTWFSVRMGSVIVAWVSLVQSTSSLISLLIVIRWREKVSLNLQFALREYDFFFIRQFLVYIQGNILSVAMVVIILIIIYICSAVSLMHGSYQLKTWLILPFIIFDFIKILLLSVIFMAGMLVIKKNILHCNIMIVCSTIGGFYLLSQYYIWLCPVSLLQCISVVNSNRMKKNNSKMDNNSLIFHNYQSDFQLFKPVMSNRDYHQYQYQYGNLPKLYF